MMKYIILALTIVYMIIFVLELRKIKERKNFFGITSILLCAASAVMMIVCTVKAFQDAGNLILYMVPAAILLTIAGYFTNKASGKGSFMKDLMPMVIGFVIAIIIIIIFMITE